MKKLLLIPTLLASSLALAKDYNLEFTPQIGYDFVGGKIPLKDFSLVGAELQYNGFDSPIKPELSTMYSITDYETIPGYVDYADTTVVRLALNGVYEFKGFDSFTPLVKAGVGYDMMDDPYEAVEEGIFIDAGAGVKIPFSEKFALKLEAVYISKFNDTTYDGNLALLAGINIPFWDNTPEPEPQTQEDPAEPVVEVTPKKAPAPAVVDGDDDHDGILNSVDECPNTSKNVSKVYPNGCAALVEMPVNFEFDSAKVTGENIDHVKEYVIFMNDHVDYKAKIVGHTDSLGSKAYNQKLSLKRAEAVKEIIVKEGIDPQRLTTQGQGETSPIADNTTKIGQAQNRRIEIEIIK
jgi:OmpA-OmpF porin, OOP family